MKQRILATCSVLSMCIAGTSPAIAADDSGWHPVLDIRTYDSGTTIVTLDGTFEETCSQVSKFEFKDAGGEGSHYMKLVLAALLSGKTIKAEFQGCNSSNTRPVIRALNIR